MPTLSGLLILSSLCRDILHPSRANISKEELREKLAGLYKANKEQVSVFGLRTQFGGGKTTGFALVYDSPEAMKKFEPQYRLIRVGLATKVERASRQQRTSKFVLCDQNAGTQQLTFLSPHRQAAQEQAEDSARHSKGQGCQGEEGEINGWRSFFASSSTSGFDHQGRTRVVALCITIWNATLHPAIDMTWLGIGNPTWRRDGQASSVICST